MSDVLVLCYHAVSTTWSASLSVAPDRMDWQLQTLLRRGYRATTFFDAVTQPPAPRTLAVTFDDAYRSVREIAFPLLSRLGVPATVFVPTRFPGSTDPMAWPGIEHWLEGPHEGELRCMTWDDIAQLDRAGWEIGSHTHAHLRLPSLDDSALAFELRTSSQICAERLRKPCRSLAYPFGEYDARVVLAARDAGYEAAATLPSRLGRPARLAWPRVGVYHEDGATVFRAKVSPTMRRLRSLPGWAVVNTTRSLVQPRP